MRANQRIARPNFLTTSIVNAPARLPNDRFGDHGGATRAIATATEGVPLSREIGEMQVDGPVRRETRYTARVTRPARDLSLGLLR
jgi:hypothetical protein